MKRFGKSVREWGVSELGEFSERRVSVFHFDGMVAELKSVDCIDQDWPVEVQEEVAAQLGWVKLERGKGA